MRRGPKEGQALDPGPLRKSPTNALPYSLGAWKNWVLARSQVASTSCSFWRSLEGASFTSSFTSGVSMISWVVIWGLMPFGSAIRRPTFPAFSKEADRYLHLEHDINHSPTHDPYVSFLTKPSYVHVKHRAPTAPCSEVGPPSIAW